MENVQIPYFIFGLVFLVLGAEVLVRRASRLAGAAGVSSLVVGLTVMAFGTSAPQMAVSIQASIKGQAEAYTVYVVLYATEFPQLPLFSNILILFVIPISVVTLFLLAVRAHRSKSC